jgi:hypothetical protein
MLAVDEKRQRSLKVLQNIKKSVSQILYEVSHTAVYQFDEKVSKWERVEVEGSGFITKNNIDDASHTLIILNKKGIYKY